MTDELARALEDARTDDLVLALRLAQREIERHGFGGFDQNPCGVRDVIGSALLGLQKPEFAHPDCTNGPKNKPAEAELLAAAREYVPGQLINNRLHYALKEYATLPLACPAQCKARAANTGPNHPQDCDWPVCGCDPYADKVIAALEESGALLSQSAEVERLRSLGLFDDSEPAKCALNDLAKDGSLTDGQRRAAVAAFRGIEAAESRAASLAAEVERLTKELDEVKDDRAEWHDAFVERGIDLDRSKARADSLADEVRRLREALGDARNNGLIYWEPRTSRGAKEKALMLSRIDAILNEVANG